MCVLGSGHTKDGYAYIVVEKINGISLKDISLPPSQEQVRALLRLFKELVGHKWWALDFGRANVMWDADNNRMALVDVEHFKRSRGSSRYLLMIYRDLYQAFEWKKMDPNKLIWQYLNSDQAIITRSSDNTVMRAKKTGGIDLNPAQMSMQVKNVAQDFKFEFNGTEINAAQIIGATFTIRTMTPVTDLPLFWASLHPKNSPGNIPHVPTPHRRGALLSCLSGEIILA